MNIASFYKYSWFADLAYVEWDGIDLDENEMVEAAVKSERMPSKLAENVFLEGSENFSVLNYHPNDTEGFKASLYENGNEKVLSICGTEPPGVDLMEADLQDIGKFGVAINQAVSMFNYIMRLTAAESQADVLQLSWKKELIPADGQLPNGGNCVVDQMGQNVTECYYFEANYNGQGLGNLISEGDQITLTGHSLGGHLAALGQRLFPALFDQTVTYNAPGFDPPSSMAGTDQIVNLFSEYLPESPADSFSSLNDRLITLESEDTVPGDDNDIVSGSITGEAATEEKFVITEMNNHSISQMVDALGVQTLLEAMNPSWSLEEAGDLLTAGSSDPGLSEEVIVNKLSRLLLEGDSAKPLPVNGEASGIWFKPAPFDYREVLHERLHELQNIIEEQSFTIQSLSGLSASEIKNASSGEDEIALSYRYALINLNPFVLLGADYSKFNQNGELDLFNGNTKQGNLSVAYLYDRADMLSKVITNNINDGENSSKIKYKDVKSGITVVQPDLSEPQKSIVFGSEKGGRLEGTNIPTTEEGFNDRIYGMSGSDIIKGYAGDDYLEGGKGRDTMLGGDGNDTFYVIYPSG